MNEVDRDILQTLVEHYRNKCSQLEYDFLLYVAQSQKTIKELAQRIESSSSNNGSRNDSREKNDTDAKNKS